MVTCPNCRTENADEAAFCSNCETYLGWSADPEPDASPAAISVQLSADALSVTPGTETGCTVWVRNSGTTPVELTLDLYESAAMWASVEPATLVVPGGGQARAHIRLLPPAAGATAGGPRRLGVRATPADHTAAVSAEAVVGVAAVVDFQLRVDPAASTAHRIATHRIVVDNVGNAPVSVDLTADDGGDDEALQLELAEDHLEVAASATADTALTATIVGPRLIGRSTARHFSVTATDGRIPTRRATGTVTATARLPLALTLIGGAVIAAAMVLIGVVAAVRDDDTTPTTPAPPPTVPPTLVAPTLVFPTLVFPPAQTVPPGPTFVLPSPTVFRPPFEVDPFDPFDPFDP